MLLCREHTANSAGIRELNLDIGQWQPLIEDRAFLAWLVKVPGEAEVLRARHMRPRDMAALEELWKRRPEASADDLGKEAEGPEAEEVLPVVLRYEDAYQYQNVFGPLVQMEAKYDQVRRPRCFPPSSLRPSTCLPSSHSLISSPPTLLPQAWAPVPSRTPFTTPR